MTDATSQAGATKSTMSATEAASPSTIAVFAVGALPLSALGLPILSFMPRYYDSTLGLDIAIIGMVVFYLRFWDVINDPFIGILQSRTSSKIARRKIWLGGSAPFLLIAVWMIFFASPGVSGLYLAAALFLLYVGTTMAQVSHMSWAAELAHDYDARARIHAIREVFLIAGMVIILAIPSVMGMLNIGSFTLKMQIMGGAILSFIVISFGITILLAPEPKPADNAEKVNFFAAVKSVPKTPWLWRLITCDILHGLNLGTTGTLFLYYFSDVKQLEMDHTFPLLFCYFVSGIAGIPFWMRFAKDRQKHTTMLAAALWGGCSLAIVLLLPPGQYWLTLMFLLFAGFAFGAAPFLLRGMMADYAEYDFQNTGENRVAFLYSLLIFTQKCGYAIGGSVPLMILAWFGYSSRPGHENSDAAINALYWIYAIPPLLSLIGVLLVMRNYTLTRQRIDSLIGRDESTA